MEAVMDLPAANEEDEEIVNEEYKNALKVAATASR